MAKPMSEKLGGKLRDWLLNTVRSTRHKCCIIKKKPPVLIHATFSTIWLN